MDEDAGIDKARVISEVESTPPVPESPPPSPPPPAIDAPSPSPGLSALVVGFVGVVWLVVGLASRRGPPFLIAALFLAGAVALGFGSRVWRR